MPWTRVDEDAIGFSDGSTANSGTGHIYTLPAGAPTAGDIDVLFVNSDATVVTPSGWTLPSNASRVNNQGGYAYYRIASGGESGTVTIKTGADVPAVAGWSRWRGGAGAAFEVAAVAGLDSEIGGATPALNLTVAVSGSLVVVGALLHHLATPTPNTPVWSSGYTGLTEVTQGSGTSGCVQFVGYRTDAPAGTETPSCTWTDGAFERYVVGLAFSPSPGINVDLARATETDTGRTLTPAKTGAISRATETDTSRPLAASKTAAPARATESDTGRALALSKTLTLGQATSTETARPLTAGKTVALGRATETDTAGTLVTGQATPLGQAAETTTARTLTAAKTLALGRASETATAQPLTVARLVSLSRAVETLTARPAALAKAFTLTRASETTTAHALTASGGTPPATLDHLGGTLLDTGLLGGTLL